MWNKRGVIGDRDSVLGFKAAGLDVFALEDAQAASRQLHKMAKEYAVIFVTEQMYVQMEEAVSRYKAQAFPAIIPIPGSKGALGVGMAQLHKNVEKAVGADILLK